MKKKFDDIPADNIKFWQWRRVSVRYGEGWIKKVKLVEAVSKKDEFIEDFKAALEVLREHSYRVTTQYTQIRLCRSEMLPLTECSIQIDYSENFACCYQNEVSAAFYDRNQITLHPMVVHHRTADLTLQHISFVGISEEKAHTVPTTLAFLTALHKVLKELLPHLKVVHYVSDSPSSQYRNKTAVALMANHKKLFGTDSSWHWLESGHGKGPCDGVGGCVKKMAEVQVKRGSIISDAETFYNVMSAVKETKMKFVRVTHRDVVHSQAVINKWSITPISGLMQAHALVPHSGHLYWRATSCFKQCCYEDGLFHPACPGWFKTSITISEAEAAHPGPQGEDVEHGDDVDPTPPEEDDDPDLAQVDVSPPSRDVNSDPSEVAEAAELGPQKENVERGDDVGSDPGHELVNHSPPTMHTSTATIYSAKAADLVSQAEDEAQFSNLQPLKEGDFVAAPYDQKWFIGKVIGVRDERVVVSFMSHFRGKFKWGRTDEMEIDLGDILCRIGHPSPVGKMFELGPGDLENVTSAFKAYQEKL